jgi:hypothetical protein
MAALAGMSWIMPKSLVSHAFAITSIPCIAPQKRNLFIFATNSLKNVFNLLSLEKQADGRLSASIAL